MQTMFDVFKSWDLNVKYGRITALEGGIEQWLHTYPNQAVDNSSEKIFTQNKDRNVINDMLNNVEYNFDNDVTNGLNTDKNQRLESLMISPLPKMSKYVLSLNI